ncbi:MAG: MAPEG family protein [Burkholderiaceae bacterium]
MQILPMYAALLGFLFFYLSIRTIGLRRRLKIGIGAKENDEMIRGMRVHSNFAEYVPITLLLIYFVEIQGGHQLLIHALGAHLLVGRSVHAYGVSQINEKFVFRVSGMVMTFTALLISACILLFNFFTK